MRISKKEHKALIQAIHKYEPAFGVVNYEQMYKHSYAAMAGSIVEEYEKSEDKKGVF